MQPLQPLQPMASGRFASSQATATTRADTRRTRRLLALADVRDARYPRHWWLRALRQLASMWWLLFLAYLAYGATRLLLPPPPDAVPRGSLLAIPTLAQAFGLSAFVSLLTAEPWLLGGGGVTLLAAAAAAAVVQRRAAHDRVREAMTLLLREVRASEQANPAWVQQALLPAMEQRIQSLRRRRLVLGMALGLAALVVGALLALMLPA